MKGKHKLRAERDLHSLTQKALAARSSVSASTISNIECHRGPDVPRDQLRRTKTKLSTALKIVDALSQLDPGEYTVKQFAAGQSIFTEAEIFEAVVNELAREKRRAKTKRARARKLQLVA